MFGFGYGLVMVYSIRIDEQELFYPNGETDSTIRMDEQEIFYPDG